MSKRQQVALLVALLTVAAAFVIWGPTVVLYALIDPFVRGQRLSYTDPVDEALGDADDEKTIEDDPDKLVSDASEIVGRPVGKDAYSLARMVRSEEGHQPDAVKELLCHVALNDAAEHGWSTFFVLTVSSNPARSGFYGNQTSRRYSTVLDPYGSDLAVAEKVLADRAAGVDPTGGAVKFFNRGATGKNWPDSWDSEGLVSEAVAPAPARLVFFKRAA